ncbi:MAG: hypothetical protein RLZZ50_1798 [Verrucomicrobiota bacterium]
MKLKAAQKRMVFIREVGPKRAEQICTDRESVSREIERRLLA